MSELTVAQIAGLQTSKYFNVAGTAILIFDYTITLKDEIRWIWGRPWDLVRIIFTISRYVPFVGMGLATYAALRSSWMPCPFDTEEGIFNVIGIVASEALLIVRTYAFWNADKRVLYGLITYAVLICAAALTINLDLNIDLLPGPLLHGCYLTSNRENALPYAFILAFEVVVLILMTLKQYRDYRRFHVRKSLTQTLFYDGVFYFLCIILITVGNVTVHLVAPVQYSDMLEIPQMTVHSVLAARIMFRLRKFSHDVQMSGLSMPLSTMAISEFEVRAPTELDPESGRNGHTLVTTS